MSEQKLDDASLSIRADIEIIEREILTDEDGKVILDENGKPKLGEIVGSYEEQNIILNQGKGFVLRGFSGVTGKQVKTIKLGKDVGTGTVLLPQDPVATLTEADFDLVYATPPEEFFISYPTTNSVRYLATINGANVMIGYPTLPNVIYTSASIFCNDDTNINYKRFPARTISALISVDISWTVTIN